MKVSSVLLRRGNAGSALNGRAVSDVFGWWTDVASRVVWAKQRRRGLSRPTASLSIGIGIARPGSAVLSLVPPSVCRGPVRTMDPQRRGGRKGAAKFFLTHCRVGLALNVRGSPGQKCDAWRNLGVHCVLAGPLCVNTHHRDDACFSTRCHLCPSL